MRGSRLGDLPTSRYSFDTTRKRAPPVVLKSDMSDLPHNNLQGATEYVQATIAVEHLDSAVIESHVRKVVESTPGVQTVHLIEGKLHVCYDPLQTSERELEAAIQRAGEHPIEGSAERTSPFADLS